MASTRGLRPAADGIGFEGKPSKSAALAKWSADAVRAFAARPERVETINTQHRAIVEEIANHGATSGLQLLQLRLRPLSEITSVLPDED